MNTLKVLGHFKYKILIFENIYECLDHPLLDQYWLPYLRAKQRGYCQYHGDNFLIFDALDYISTHIAICTVNKNNGLITPVTTCRVTLLNVCKHYKIEFPFLKYLKGCTDRKVIEATLSEWEAEALKIAYSGGFTINLPRAGNKAIFDELKKIYASAHYYLHKHDRIDVTCGFASVASHTEKLFQSWGIKNFYVSDQKIGPYTSELFNNDGIIPMAGEVGQFSELKKSIAEKYKVLWDNRIVISKKTQFRTGSGTGSDIAA